MREQLDEQNPPRLEFRVHFENGRCGRRHLRKGTRPKTRALPHKDVPRLTRLLALAHRWDRLIEEGVIANHAEIARMMGLSRARVAQITNLLYLAPDIQEELLLPSSTERPGLNFPERVTRPVASIPTWSEQRRLWRELRRLQTRRKEESDPRDY
jgi:hypothetical protein